jgi:hypothetical protein
VKGVRVDSFRGRQYKPYPPICLYPHWHLGPDAHARDRVSRYRTCMTPIALARKQWQTPQGRMIQRSRGCTNSNQSTHADIGRVKKGETHMYLGPSVEGYMCEPRILPQCPIAMNIGMPVAFLVSEPRLCATIENVSFCEGKSR